MPAKKSCSCKNGRSGSRGFQNTIENSLKMLGGYIYGKKKSTTKKASIKTNPKKNPQSGGTRRRRSRRAKN
jgi:hypothetical protein